MGCILWKMERLLSGLSPEEWTEVFVVLLKMGLGALLGGAIGFERERAGRPPGLRTHMLICVGVVLFGEVSKAFAGEGDPSRIASNVVTGIGFLGAGSILRMGLEVRGLTTAASIWVTAAIGLAISAGGPYYLVAIASTGLTLLTLTVVEWALERGATKPATGNLVVHCEGFKDLPEVLSTLVQAGAEVERLQIDREEGGMRLRVSLKGDRDTCLSAILSLGGVRSAEWRS
ncbi:MAG: MgtC/SapB family protein [Fimbriimonadales bacterium]|nr:MgtC/SapB family protein [Fimbriimonadales bacterium]